MSINLDECIPACWTSKVHVVSRYVGHGLFHLQHIPLGLILKSLVRNIHLTELRDTFVGPLFGHQYELSYSLSVTDVAENFEKLKSNQKN